MSKCRFRGGDRVRCLFADTYKIRNTDMLKGDLVVKQVIFFPTVDMFQLRFDGVDGRYWDSDFVKVEGE